MGELENLIYIVAPFFFQIFSSLAYNLRPQRIQMGDTPQARRSGRIRKPTRSNPMNVADPPIPERRPSTFEIQRRSESAKKGWEMRRNRGVSSDDDIQVKTVPSDRLQVSSTLFAHQQHSGSQATNVTMSKGKGSNTRKGKGVQQSKASYELHNVTEEELSQDDNEQRSESVRNGKVKISKYQLEEPWKYSCLSVHRQLLKNGKDAPRPLPYL